MPDMLDERRVPQRVIHQADALVWLAEKNILPDCSIITSLPDISEFPNMSLSEWKTWFINAATLVLTRCPDNGITIFYQSDIRKDGEWIDKGFLVQKAAEKVDHILIAHKIICRAPAGTATFGRPAYSRLLAFAKDVRIDVSKAYADVLPDAGEVTWTRGMGLNACRLACKMVLNYTNTRTIVDPFCGHGSVLAVANAMGLDAIGVDKSAKCVKKARANQFR